MINQANCHSLRSTSKRALLAAMIEYNNTARYCFEESGDPNFTLDLLFHKDRCIGGAWCA